jgi:anti-sigma regulatory factor (Ser/Thr protein kinase)
MTGHSFANGRLRHGFRHTAVVVDSDDAIGAVLVPELQRSIEAAEPVLMVVGDRTAGLVRAALGPGSRELEWGSSAAFYQRLGFAYESFRRYLAAQQAVGRRVHVVAEPDFGDATDADTVAERAAGYLSYESICNDVYAPYGSAVTCLWDTRRYPAEIIEGVHASHNHDLTPTGPVPNRRYRPPEQFLSENHNSALEQTPSRLDHDLNVLEPGQLGLLRAALRMWTDERRFDRRAAGDVAVAVTEIVANGLAHGSPPVRVRAWHRGDTLVVQVDDQGGRPIAPTAGYRPPDPDSTSAGRGIWLARQLADTVTVRTTAGRTSVRLQFPHDVTHRHPT